MAEYRYSEYNLTRKLDSIFTMLRTKVPGGNELLNPEALLKNQLGLTFGMKVGDFGCGGGGYFALEASRLVGDHGQVFAVDVLQSVLSNVASRAQGLGIENVITVWSNLEVFGATRILDDSLDVGLIINVLFQNKEPRCILREAARMVRPGGFLLVVDWKEGRFPLGPLPQDKVSPQTVRRVAHELGLQEQGMFDAGPFHYGIILEKSLPPKAAPRMGYGTAPAAAAPLKSAADPGALVIK